MVEIFSPKNEEGPVAGGLGVFGESVYLVSMKVDDLGSTVAKLRQQDVRRLGVPECGDPATGQLFIYPSEPSEVLVGAALAAFQSSGCTLTYSGSRVGERLLNQPQVVDPTWFLRFHLLADPIESICVPSILHRPHPTRLSIGNAHARDDT